MKKKPNLEIGDALIHHVLVAVLGSKNNKSDLSRAGVTFQIKKIENLSMIKRSCFTEKNFNYKFQKDRNLLIHEIINTSAFGI